MTSNDEKFKVIFWGFFSWWPLKVLQKKENYSKYKMFFKGNIFIADFLQLHEYERGAEKNCLLGFNQ